MNEWRPHVVVTPHFVVRADQLARLAHAHPRVDVYFATSREEYSAMLPEVDAAVTGFGLSPEQLASATHLRWLQNMGAGVERLLTPELRQSDLIITATKGPMGVLMAEHVVTLMLALARDLPAFFGDQQARRWRRYPSERRPAREMAGRTMLVLGVGAVGREVARMCKLGFQMQVLGYARSHQDCPHIDCYVTPDDLPSALGEADVVSLSLPVTPATLRIIDAAALAKFKSGAFLINVARGQLVDQNALIAALQSGQLGGAGLDAFAEEPLPPESPLWDMPNVIVTPHTSAITDRLGDHFVDFWAENLRRFADGETLLGLVDKAAGY
ncbi:MAG TPA: D-2-hydroxyacid dehydrogenase [Chloroflexota bacterium]|nr:D-2-hydroxyacid dehydrogenase [Chloroflexota bacterium]